MHCIFPLGTYAQKNLGSPGGHLLCDVRTFCVAVFELFSLLYMFDALMPYLTLLTLSMPSSVLCSRPADGPADGPADRPLLIQELFKVAQ